MNDEPKKLKKSVYYPFSRASLQKGVCSKGCIYKRDIPFGARVIYSRANNIAVHESWPLFASTTRKTNLKVSVNEMASASKTKRFIVLPIPLQNVASTPSFSIDFSTH